MVSKVAITWDMEPFLPYPNLYGNPCSPQHPEDALLASLTRESNTEIARWSRDVGGGLNYSRSLLLMNALSEALMSLLCMKLLGGQNKTSTLHRNATSGNLLLLSFSLFQNCWVTYTGCWAKLLPNKVRKVRSWRGGRSISSLAALSMDREAGPFCTYLGALGRAQGSISAPKRVLIWLPLL